MGAMRGATLRTLVAGFACVAAAGIFVHAQQAPADTILTTGKIITVDNRFSIEEAVESTPMPTL